MSLERKRVSIGAVTVTVVALLLLTPGPSSEHLEAAGHDHEASPSVAVEAVHTTLPAHFDASSPAVERSCSACLLQAPTVLRFALLQGVEALPPVVALGLQPRSRVATGSSGRLDLSRAPPSIVG